MALACITLSALLPYDQLPLTPLAYCLMPVTPPFKPLGRQRIFQSFPTISLTEDFILN